MNRIPSSMGLPLLVRLLSAPIPTGLGTLGRFGLSCSGAGATIDAASPHRDGERNHHRRPPPARTRQEVTVGKHEDQCRNEQRANRTDVGEDKRRPRNPARRNSAARKPSHSGQSARGRHDVARADSKQQPPRWVARTACRDQHTEDAGDGCRNQIRQLGRGRRVDDVPVQDKQDDAANEHRQTQRTDHPGQPDVAPCCRLRRHATTAPMRYAPTGV